jgi:hypothetical protein
VLEPSWISLQSADSSVSIGLPSTFHSALDRAPAPQLNTEQPPEPPQPDETGGGDPNVAAQQAPSQTDVQGDQAMKRVIGDLNNMSAQMEEQQHQEVVDKMTKEGLVIWGWLNGRATVGEKLTQISVKKIPDAKASTLDAAVTAAKEGMPGGVTVTDVTLPIGETKKAYADYQNRIGDEQTEIQYVLLDNGDEYIVRFAATNGKEQIEPIADAVMQTLRIKPKP